MRGVHSVAVLPVEESDMGRISVVFIALFLSTAVMANAPVSEADAQKIRAALQAWSGGKVE